MRRAIAYAFLLMGMLASALPAQAARLALVIGNDHYRAIPGLKNGRAIGGRGLTGVAGATGQMVIYSAGEGQEALDRLDDHDHVRNGLFTRVFLREMRKPGVPVNDVVRHVREEVHRLARKAHHQQVPAIYDQVLGKFYFYAPTLHAAEADSPAIELAFWNSIKDSKDGQEFTAYPDHSPA